MEERCADPRSLGAAVWRRQTVRNQEAGHELAAAAKQGNTARFYSPDNLGKLSVESVQEVQAISLDEAAERYGFTDAAFLKLDTQGTELDILKSGSRLLPAVQAIYVEAAFQPFYCDQPLFADVDSFMRANGFVLFALNRTAIRRHAGHRPSVYTQHMVAWAHCLYIREPDASEDREALVRLLALAVSLQCFDVAFEVAARLHLPDTVDAEIQRCAAFATRVMLDGDDSPEALAALTARVSRDKG